MSSTEKVQGYEAEAAAAARESIRRAGIAALALLLALALAAPAAAAGPPKEIGKALRLGGRNLTFAKSRPINRPGEVVRTFNPFTDFMFLPGQFEARYGLTAEEAVPLSRCYVGGHAGNAHANAVMENYVQILQGLGLLAMDPDVNRSRDQADVLWTCSREWLYQRGVALGIIVEATPPPVPTPSPPPAPAPAPPPPPVRTDMCRQAEAYIPSVLSTGKLTLELVVGPPVECPPPTHWRPMLEPPAGEGRR